MTSRIAYNNPDPAGAFNLSYHYELLADSGRLTALRRAIQLVAGGKRVLESGAGSGVLSILAARAGARVVYAVEKDPAIARFLWQNVRRAGCAPVVRIVEADTLSLSLADLDWQPVDVVIAEHLSTWQVTEPQVALMNHVNRHLAHAETVRVPQRACNRLQLVRSRFRFEDAVELRTHFFCFSGIRRPAVLSAAAELHEVDFAAVNDGVVDRSVEVLATRTGVVNSLRLTSPLRIFGDISFRSSDSLMPPVVVPLARDLAVHAGDVVEVRCRYRHGTRWDQFQCAAEVIDSPRTVARAALLPERYPEAAPMAVAGVAGE